MSFPRFHCKFPGAAVPGGRELEKGSRKNAGTRLPGRVRNAPAMGRAGASRYAVGVPGGEEWHLRFRTRATVSCRLYRSFPGG